MVDFMRQDELPELSVSDTLDARHEVYGKFIELAAVARQLREVIQNHLELRGKALDDDMDEALTLICSKIARIVNGSQYHIDNWHDIAGYAQLVADRLRGNSR